MLTPSDFLLELTRRGATRLRRVSFRRNRTVLWSLTQRGTVLNVHTAYATASEELIDAFALVVRQGGVRTRAAQLAAATIEAWPAVGPAVQAVRASRESGPQTGDCATPEQTRYLRALYRYLNITRFGQALPTDVPIRLSSRMVSALGHMLPADEEGGRLRISEIALNVDLMLAGNGAERIDTLLHEMAHVADYLESGNRGHGETWRIWARRVGCRPDRLYDRPVVRRRRRHMRVTRVPPLPGVIQALAD